jgi:hypothetical protein
VDQRHLMIPPSYFMVHDLRKPLHLNHRFDLVVSLEVAEHLPPESAVSFVNTLCQLGDVVLFSAAIPFQGGEHHVNEQWPDYWAAMFESRGYFACDIIRPLIWNDARVSWCYRQNTFLFLNEAARQQYPKLGSTVMSPSELHRLVHPEKYLEITQHSLSHQIQHRLVNSIRP